MHSQLRNGSVAQLNRASDYGSEGSGFESQRSHKIDKMKRYLLRVSVSFLVYYAVVVLVLFFALHWRNLLHFLLLNVTFLGYVASLKVVTEKSKILHHPCKVLISWCLRWRNFYIPFCWYGNIVIAAWNRIGLIWKKEIILTRVSL